MPFLSVWYYFLIDRWTDLDGTLGVYTIRLWLSPEVPFHFRSKPGNRKLALNVCHETDFISAAIFFMCQLKPIHSRWVWLTRGKNWYQNIVGFMAKKPTSGFQIPTGSGKVPQAIARVELWTPPKFHSHRFTRLGGDSFANIKKTNLSKT